MATTQPGGLYTVNGKTVDASGQPAKPVSTPEQEAADAERAEQEAAAQAAADKAAQDAAKAKKTDAPKP